MRTKAYATYYARTFEKQVDDAARQAFINEAVAIGRKVEVFLAFNHREGQQCRMFWTVVCWTVRKSNKLAGTVRYL